VTGTNGAVNDGTNSYFSGGQMMVDKNGTLQNNPYNYFSSSSVLVNNPAMAITGQTTINNGWSLIVGGHYSSDILNLNTVEAANKYDGLIAQGASDTIMNNGALIINNRATTMSLPKISGSGDFDLQGPATTILKAANDYTGATNIYDGTLQLGAGASIAASSSVNLFASGYGNINALPFYGLNPTLDVSGANASAGTPVTVSLNNLTSSRGGTVKLGANSLSVTNSGDQMFAGAITGTGAVAWGGSGSLTLNGVSTFTGGLTINNGLTVKAGTNSNALGAGDVINNGTLMAGTDQFFVPNHQINVVGNYTQGANGNLVLDIGGANKGINYDTMTVGAPPLSMARLHSRRAMAMPRRVITLLFRRKMSRDHSPRSSIPSPLCPCNIIPPMPILAQHLIQQILAAHKRRRHHRQAGGHLQAQPAAAPAREVNRAG
jgi:autotransporter-associated beta strand protein